jgi:hypothetical protein
MATAPTTKNASSVAETEIPQAIIAEASAICKRAGKLMHETALFGGRVMESGFAFRQVMSEGAKLANMARGQVESLIANASPFIAPARLVARGEKSEKDFRAIDYKSARLAFKQAGGAKGEGFEPKAWEEAFANPKEIKKDEITPPSGSPLSPFMLICGAFEAHKDKLTPAEIDELFEMIKKHRASA